MKSFTRRFLNGLFAILPISVSIFAGYWLLARTEKLLGEPLKKLLGDGIYREGFGVLVGLVIIYCAGLALEFWLVRRLFNWAEGLLEKIPLFKTIYGSIKDVLSFFSSGKDKKDKKSVVVIDLMDNLRVMGLVTRETLQGLHENFGDDNDIAVFIPMSYQMGGFTVVVPKSIVKPVDMDFESGIRFALTAWMSTGKE